MFQCCDHKAMNNFAWLLLKGQLMRLGRLMCQDCVTKVEEQNAFQVYNRLVH